MKYPLVKQEGLKNCGPCSLASVIMYYGGYISIDALEDMMGTTKDGTTAYNLIQTARKIGFESLGLKLDDLNNIECPCIAHVTLSNIYNHYVVIYKIIDDKVLIGDPASKLKYMTKNEFQSIWNNIIITLKPLKKLPYNKTKSLFSYISNIVFKYKYAFIFLIIISIMSAITSLLYSLLAKYMIDNFMLARNIIIFFIILFIFKYFLLCYKNKVEIDLEEKISVDLTNGINSSIISLPYIYYKNHTVGEVISRFNDSNSIITFFNNIVNSITMLPVLFISLYFMYKESNILFFYMLIFLMLYVLFNYITSKVINENIKKLKVSDAHYNSTLVEILTAFETIKGINIEKKMEEKINIEYKKYKNTLCKTKKIYNLREIILDIILNLGLFVIIIFGLFMQKQGIITIGSLVTFYLLYNLTIEPISLIMSLILSYNEACNSVRRIQELTYYVTSKKVSKGSIEYRNVNYGSGINDILENVNLKIEEAEKVAIIGGTGMGKSTLMKLLKGYYNADGIYIGNNIIKSKVDNVSYINQKEYLFEGTVQSNLMCDDNELIDEVIKLCLIDKNLNLFIEEDGFNLSGGDKAKIVLARTLLNPFDILIIDEGLSELDIETERKIIRNIFGKYHDKTIIIVTHRYDNLDLFDHIVKIKDKKIFSEIKYSK